MTTSSNQSTDSLHLQVRDYKQQPKYRSFTSTSTWLQAATKVQIVYIYKYMTTRSNQSTDSLHLQVHDYKQ